VTLEVFLLIALKVLAVLVLVGINGFFVAAEFALVKVRDTQLQPLIAQGNRRARMAQHILQNLDAYLSAAQLGITLASLALGWIGEPIFEALLQPVFGWLGWTGEAWHGVRDTIAFAVGFSVITFLHIVVGEQAPKSLAIKQPLVGALSDRTNSRLGRRTPYFLIGAIMCSLGLFFMPHSSSLLMAASLLWFLDAGNNITMEPYRA